MDLSMHWPEAQSPAATSKQQEKFAVIFVVGPPGAGKSTLSLRLGKQFGLCHLSVGNHLRALRDHPETYRDDAFGGLSRESIEATLKKRELIGPEAMTAILRHKMDEEKSKGHSLFLIDGFPRSDASAEAFEEIAKPLNVIVFECEKAITEKRFLDRAREAGDDQKMFAKRYVEYEDNNKVITARYPGLVKSVDTNGAVDESYKSLLECLKGIMPKG